MPARSSYRTGFFILAVLAGIPSLYAWLQDPLVITRHEFDFSLGWLADLNGLTPLPWILGGYLVHILLLSGLGWFFYKIILAESNRDAPFTRRDWLWMAALVTPFLWHLPWLSPDVFCYLGIGWIQSAHGMNPYTQMNSQAPDFPFHPIYQNIFPLWNHVITPYGPLYLPFISWVTEWADGSERMCLIILKFFHLGIHLLTAWLAARIAPLLGMFQRATFLFFFLNPALLHCYVGRMHNDAILIPCLLAGLLFLLKEKAWWAVFFFALGAGFKYVPILMIPCFLAYAMKGDWRPANILRMAGLALFFALLCLAQHLLFENGPAIFWQMLTSKDQLQINVVHFLVGGIIDATGLMPQSVFNALSQVVFFSIYAWMGFSLLRKGRSLLPQDVLITLILMFFWYFTLTSARIHEWYAGWFLVCFFAINRLDYFRVGLVSCLGLQVLAILTGLRSIPVNLTGWFLISLLIAACLRYLYRPGASGDLRPSPLFQPHADGSALSPIGQAHTS
jgi:alpha-1,6-mannosyltransferase